MPEPDIQLTFDGPAVERHQLEVDRVVEVLEVLQRSLRVLASAEQPGWAEGFRRKFAPSKAIAQRVVLRMGPPVAGSLTVPLYLGPGNDGPLNGLHQLLSWSAAEGPEPEAPPKVLDYLLESIERVLPGGAELAWCLGVRGQRVLRLDHVTRERTRALREALEFERLDIKGKLVSASLEEGEVSVLHPPSGRRFRVPLSRKLRRDLTLDPDQWLVVRGEFWVLRDGSPRDLRHVERVELPDLRPLRLQSFTVGDRRIRFDEPLELTVSLDPETHQLYVATDEALHLHVFAYERDDLQAELIEQLVFLWTSYAEAPPSALTPEARQLRARLLARCTEAPA